MEESTPGEIIYEIINYSKKGIIHNYKGLNTHFQKQYMDRSRYTEIISEEILENGVRELIKSGLLHKTGKKSFCITREGSKYAKYNTKSEIIERYSEISLTKGDKSGRIEFTESFTDNSEETEYVKENISSGENSGTESYFKESADFEISENIISDKDNSEEIIAVTDTDNSARSEPEALSPDKGQVITPEKNRFSNSEAYLDIISRFSTVKEAEPAPEPEKFLFGNVRPKSDTINSIKQENNEEAVVPGINCAGKDLSGDEQEIQDLKTVLSGGSPETEELLLRLNSKDRKVLKESLNMLGERRDASAAPDIERFLNDTSYEIFETAFEALTKIREEESRQGNQNSEH